MVVLEVKKCGDWMQVPTKKLKVNNRVRMMKDGRFVAMLRYDADGRFTTMTDNGQYEMWPV